MSSFTMLIGYIQTFEQLHLNVTTYLPTLQGWVACWKGLFLSKNVRKNFFFPDFRYTPI